MTTTVRLVVGWAAVLGTLPYLTLKFAWLAGSTVGVIDTATFAGRGVFVLNAVTAAMDLVAIVVALAFTYRWGQRVTWLGAGSMFSWGLWALVNTVGETALSGGASVPPDAVAAALGGCLIGVGSLLLLSGFSTGTAGRTAPT